MPMVLPIYLWIIPRLSKYLLGDGRSREVGDNHGEDGVNALYLGGHVSFKKTFPAASAGLISMPD